MRLCCIFNLAAHYRTVIYKMIDEHFSPDFFIGDTVGSPMKTMDNNQLNGFKKILLHKNLLGPLYWQKGEVTLVFKPYKHFLMTGNPNCLSSWLLLFFARILNKKTYLWTHGYYGDEKGLKLWLKNIFFSLGNKVFLYGDYAKNIMLEQGFSEKKLVPVYNSLDYDAQLSVRKKLSYTTIYKEKFKNDNPTIIYVGRIQKVKRIDLLVDAVDLLLRQGFRCNLVIVGKEVDYSISEKIQKQGLSATVWQYGPCFDETVLGELFYNASVCVSPGNIGLTAMHALMYGTPCVTHNNFKNQMPEFEAIEDNVTGTFFKENDIDSLIDAIKKWCSISVEERQIVRKKAYQIIDSKYNPYYQINVFRNAFL